MTKAMESKAIHSSLKPFSIRNGRFTIVEITFVRLKPCRKNRITSFGLISFSNRGKSKLPVSLNEFYKRDTSKNERIKLSVIRRALKTLTPKT